MILVSSYNTRSDTRDAPHSRRQGEWKDTPTSARDLRPPLSLTDGFSGGARASVAWRVTRPCALRESSVAARAGRRHAPIPTSPSFAYFGAVGNSDFNYYEMRELDEKLSRVGARHRIEVFDGAHDWLPAALAREAVAWLELDSMRSGPHPRDPAAIAALYAQDLARARARRRKSRGGRFRRNRWIAETSGG